MTATLGKLINQTIENAETGKEYPFTELADFLINKCFLVAQKNKLFRMTTIEFYLHSPKHPDTCVHKHPDQLEFAKWYIHKDKNSDKFVTNNMRCGIDLCFGNKKTTTYFGVLIRQLCPADGKFESPVLHDPVTLFSPLENKPIQTLNALLHEDCQYIQGGPYDNYLTYAANLTKQEALIPNDYLYIKPYVGESNNEI